MTSVPAARHVKDVFLSPQTGLLASQRQPPNKKILFMELSTIDAAASKEVAEAVMANDLGDFVDAPCSVRFPQFLNPVKIESQKSSTSYPG